MAVAATPSPAQVADRHLEALELAMQRFHHAADWVSFFRDVLNLVSTIAAGCAQINGSVSAGERQRIVDTFSDFDPRNRADWERGFRWLKKRAEEFKNIFAPRVRVLSLDDETE